MYIKAIISEDYDIAEIQVQQKNGIIKKYTLDEYDSDPYLQKAWDELNAACNIFTL